VQPRRVSVAGLPIKVGAVGNPSRRDNTVLTNIAAEPHLSGIGLAGCILSVGFAGTLFRIIVDAHGFENLAADAEWRRGCGLQHGAACQDAAGAQAGKGKASHDRTYGLMNVQGQRRLTTVVPDPCAWPDCSNGPDAAVGLIPALLAIRALLARVLRAIQQTIDQKSSRYPVYSFQT
jgi:hypothetical protein